MLCLLTIFHFPVFIFVNAALWTSRIYFFPSLCFCAFSLMLFFLWRKKYGHFGGNGPWKNLYFQVVYTRTHNKRDCSDFERDSDIHIPNSSLSLPFKHVTFAPDSRNSLCGVFLLAFCFVLYNRLHEFVFIASRRYESLFFTFSCSGCHYYTHIYIIIYKKLGVRRTGRALLFSSRVHLNKSLKKI